ncbi:MAG: Phosphoglucosamine mutase [Desulfonauticus sp. 38_4375]|nr:MAG: Phosphoglucosamine mutase [Desulfonauticus sp. 38_4375]
MGKLFGTDGIRGQANIFPMLPEIALRVGLAAGQIFRNGARRHRVVIGKDTRLSGYVFESALTSGFCASGMDVFLVGPMPTPAIAFLTRNMRADVGVVISASHNPYMDNGIKFFDGRGFKLSDEVEEEISRLVLSPDVEWETPNSDLLGRAFKIEDSPGRYIVYLKNTFPCELSLDGLKIVLDCAHGATYRVAPLIFEELGAKVIKLGVDPNGLNINKKCGSLYPEVAAENVLATGADVGFALDGDGDRLIAIDERGEVLDGDQIMAICANYLLTKDLLPQKTLVATVMSNVALEIFMQNKGGKLVRTPVGDRYVVEEMVKGGYTLGGEQSGHMVFLEHSTTGDGLLTALQLLKIMLETGKSLFELKQILQPYPQELRNVHVKEKVDYSQIPELNKALKAAEKDLAGKGRVLLRYSGTEPVLRIMVEAESPDLVEKWLNYLVEVSEKYLA